MDYSKCTECNAKLFKLKEHYTCKECGLISDYKITDHDNILIPELFYNNETPYTESGTFVPKGSKSYILKDSKYIYNDIYRLNVQILYTKEMRLYDSITDTIESICLDNYSFCIKKVSKELWLLVKHTYKAQIRKEIIGSCIYYACIDNNRPIEIDEILKIVQIDNMNKGMKIFKEILYNSNKKYLLTKKIDTIYYIYYYINKLEPFIDFHTINDIHKISTNIWNRIEAVIYDDHTKTNIQTKTDIINFINSSDKIKANSIIFLCLNGKINIQDYSKICGLSNHTIEIYSTFVYNNCKKDIIQNII